MNEEIFNTPLFNGLAREEIKTLLESVVYQYRRYSEGQLIASAGEVCNALLIVLKGRVKGEMIDFSGKVLKIEEIYPPKPLAVAFLFGQNNRYPVTVSAVVPTLLLVIPKKSVVSLMHNSEVFLVNFLNAISNRAQFISGKLRFLSFKTLQGKLAHFLIEQDNIQNKKGRIFLSKTHEELAELFGVARPSLSRAIRKLHHQGIIRCFGKNIEIINRVELKNIGNKTG